MVASAIKIAKANVTLQGLPPGLLMNSKRLMELDRGKSGAKKGAHRSPEEEAELHCHWTTVKGKKMLAFPWAGLYRSICSAASQFKWQGKKMMTELVAATISCEQDFISIGTDKYEVYPEWVRIPPRTGSMVKVGRPRIREWEMSFTLLVDDELYGKGAGMLEDIIQHAGKMVGIGPWRPSLKGPYGKFVVSKFEVV